MNTTRAHRAEQQAAGGGHGQGSAPALAHEQHEHSHGSGAATALGVVGVLVLLVMAGLIFNSRRRAAKPSRERERGMALTDDENDDSAAVGDLEAAEADRAGAGAQTERTAAVETGVDVGAPVDDPSLAGDGGGLLTQGDLIGVRSGGRSRTERGGAAAKISSTGRALATKAKNMPAALVPKPSAKKRASRQQSQSERCGLIGTSAGGGERRERHRSKEGGAGAEEAEQAGVTFRAPPGMSALELADAALAAAMQGNPKGESMSAYSGQD